MADIWFSSDLHLGHANIIKFCDRPFKDTTEMDEFLRETHNKYVKPQDHWYNLGDVTMHRGSRTSKQAQEFVAEMRRWNGHKRLVLGNHDHFPPEVYIEAGFEKLLGSGRWIDNFLISHFPIHPRSAGSCDAVVHGHIHNEKSYEPVLQYRGESKEAVWVPYINVSIEAIDYRPIHLDELRARVKAEREAWAPNQANEN